jgi:hypothetical protein
MKTVKKSLAKTNKTTVSKNPVGRPTKYIAQFAEQAKKLAMKGLIDKEIYDILGISEPIGINWKKKYPEFAKSLNEGKRNINEEVKAKLIDRALGFVFKSEKVVTISDGQGLGSHWEKVPIDEYVIPDVGAQKLWLYNRDRDNWYDSQNINMNANINDASDMTPEERHNWLIENGFIKE